jgi:hypothetical protein
MHRTERVQLPPHVAGGGMQAMYSARLHSGRCHHNATTHRRHHRWRRGRCHCHDYNGNCPPPPATGWAANGGVCSATTLTCSCEEGYVGNGVDCEAICEQGCIFGVCDRPNTCTCKAGWGGADCSKCIVPPPRLTVGSSSEGGDEGVYYPCTVLFPLYQPTPLSNQPYYPCTVPAFHPAFCRDRLRDGYGVRF